MAGIGDKKKVVLQRWHTTKDGDGNNTESVLAEIPLWADVRRLSGSRVSGNGATNLSNSIEFSVRWSPDLFLEGNWRVVYSGRKHAVQSIEKKDEKRFEVLIIADSQGKR